MTNRTAYSTGEERTASGESVCPSWCADKDTPGHWSTSDGGECWQTIHMRTFGRVVVNIPNELYHDPNRKEWVGKAELNFDNEDGDPYFTVPVAKEWVADLERAIAWATSIDEHVIERTEQGAIDSSHND